MNDKSSESIIQSKALDILASLNKKEFHMFGKYLDTFQVSNKNLKKLYLFLKKFHPVFGNAKLTKINLHKAVYSEAVYNDLNVRKLLSDIYKEGERFIVNLHLKTNRLPFEKILLDEFDLRKLDNLFIAKYDEINSILDKENAYPYRYIEKHIIEWFYVSFHLERGMQQKIAPNIFKRAEYIIFYFLSDLFTTLQDIDANKHRYNISQKVNLAEEFISCLDIERLSKYIEKNYPVSSLVMVYYLSYLTIKHFDNEKYYFELKEHVNKNFSKIHESGQRAAAIFLINYCQSKISIDNKQEFYLEINEHYKKYIKHGLYKISGENFVRIDLFLNILRNYFKVGNITQASDFLYENIQSIQPVHRKNMLALCHALIEFERNNFAVSLKNVYQIKSNTQLYKDALKILILKNNFELKNYEVAYDTCSNYIKSIEKNESISPIVKEKNLNFLLYYKRLLKICSGAANHDKIIELRNDVITGTNINEEDWLMRKIDNLLSGYKSK